MFALRSISPFLRLVCHPRHPITYHPRRPMPCHPPHPMPYHPKKVETNFRYLTTEEALEAEENKKEAEEKKKETEKKEEMRIVVEDEAEIEKQKKKDKEEQYRKQKNKEEGHERWESYKRWFLKFFGYEHYLAATIAVTWFGVPILFRKLIETDKKMELQFEHVATLKDISQTLKELCGRTSGEIIVLPGGKIIFFPRPDALDKDTAEAVQKAIEAGS